MPEELHVGLDDDLEQIYQDIEQARIQRGLGPIRATPELLLQIQIIRLLRSSETEVPSVPTVTPGPPKTPPPKGQNLEAEPHP